MTPKWYRRDLVGGESGPDVVILNRKLGIPGSTFSEDSAQYIRGVQHQSGLPVTGIVDEDTATVLGEASDHDLPPVWFRRPLGPGCSGRDVEVLRERLGLSPSDAFDEECRRAVLRLQSANRLDLTGEVDEALSLLLT